MMRAIVAIAAMSVAVAASAQEHLQKQASDKTVEKGVHNGEGTADNEYEEPASQRDVLGLCHAGLFRE